MKFSAIISLALLSSSATAFAPASKPVASSTALNAESSRQDFLKTMFAVASVPLIQVVAPESASAAKYGGFGAGSPNVFDPKEAIVDEDILKSGAVQDALGKVKGYSNLVKEMSAALDQNPQVDLGPTIRKQFDFVQLRSSLNTLNTAFDEDTQRGTDRLIRLVMQDLTELETSNRQKDGIVRSERRMDIMKGKLAKLGTSFDDFLAFAN
ncbi:expressed unknown protein [Seminavis robusta]|uniref:Uncharacterized protein n=1 Tax=Seminavis robusta TaxID=568900 RepID=A0A9N8EFW4_9STRA|nr:expressed unknown protein [Seminavis robusta]|eukprot:Sro1097_g240840.1 n/a (210) ;mRNA; f:11154-11862